MRSNFPKLGKFKGLGSAASNLFSNISPDKNKYNSRTFNSNHSEARVPAVAEEVDRVPIVCGLLPVVQLSTFGGESSRATT